MRLHNLFEELILHWPKALIPADAIQGIMSIGNNLPPLSAAIVECRLADDRRCDFSVRASRHDGGIKTLAGVGQGENIAPELQQNSTWQKIQTFARQCYGKQELFADINHIWLEFDDMARHSPFSVPVPSIFFGISTEIWEQNSLPLQNALRDLASISDGLFESLTMQLLKLPANVELHYLGLMLPRGKGTVRCSLKLSLTALKDCLASILLPLSQEDLAFLQAAAIANQSDWVILHFDIGADGGVRYGFELPIESGKSHRTLLAFLVKAGLCLPSKGTAVNHWLRQSLALRDQNVVERASLIPNEDGQLLFDQRINHVKLIYDAVKGFIEAKIYLYIGLGWDA